MPTPKYAGDYQTFITYATKYINQQMQQHDIQGLSIAVVDGDNIIWKQGFGYADAENGIKATANTTYRVGSLSKTLNAVAILKLQEQGKLNINSPIDKYLPNFRMKSDKALTHQVTLRNIMTHDSGIAPLPPLSGMESEHMSSCKNLLSLLQQNYLKFPPNTVMSYSNQAVGLSGCVVEKITHQKYSDYITKQLLNPLEMTNSRYESSIHTKNHSKCYRNGIEVPDDSYYFMPAIGVSSNVVDMSHFLIMMLQDGRYKGKQILSKSSIDRMLRWDNKNIQLDWDEPMALGWFILDEYPSRFYYHTGRASAYISAMAFSKEAGLGIVLSSNSDEDKGYLKEIMTHLFSFAWQAKFDKKLSLKQTMNRIHPSPLQSNFAGKYALESEHSEIITIKQTSHNKFKVQTQYGAFSLIKNSNLCYEISDPNDTTQNIENLKDIPTNSCFYTIPINNIKGIVYKTPDNQYYGLALQMQEDKSSKLWNQYVGVYTPAFEQYAEEKFKDIELYDDLDNIFLSANMTDGISHSLPLTILDKNHAKSNSIIIPLGTIEIQKKGSEIYLLIDGHLFRKEE